MNHNPQLVVMEGALKGQAFEVTSKGLDIGRDSTCQVCLPDPGVSRSHARVFLHNSAVWVQDNGSRNGAFVNGKRLQRPKTLSPGAELKVGEHLFQVRLTGELLANSGGGSRPDSESEDPQVQSAPPPTEDVVIGGEPTVAIEVPGRQAPSRAVAFVVLLLAVVGIAAALVAG